MRKQDEGAQRYVEHVTSGQLHAGASGHAWYMAIPTYLPQREISSLYRIYLSVGQNHYRFVILNLIDIPRFYLFIILFSKLVRITDTLRLSCRKSVSFATF